MLPSIYAFIGSYYLSRFADQAFANATGLSTFRHGTNPISWLGIHILGGRPSMGGSSFGAGSTMRPLHKNRFYFWGKPTLDKKNLLDSLNDELDILTDTKISAIHSIASIYIYSTARFFNSDVKWKSFLDKIKICVGLAFSSLVASFAPSIKFRFSPEQKFSQEAQKFSCFTIETVYPWHIGLVGTLYNSCTPKTFKRMWDSPSRTITGVAMLAFSTYAAHYAVTYHAAFLAAHRTAMITGGLLAVI